ncbi:uncharacterized protein LOC62_02G003207 [Vanrija pseudolonga]|uniref:Myb-like domain-containing protein n=1 Tax=Vanrija pseudolonga TaxID=143232 RepID=A0AAF0Y449_9TREE|nr:hypothetical protein LOC62_02G003207 [Vanrija pseudolonga]
MSSTHHPSTPPRDINLTPTLSSPVTPPPPETPYASLPTPRTAQQLRRLEAVNAPEALRPVKLAHDDMSITKGKMSHHHPSSSPEPLKRRRSSSIASRQTLASAFNSQGRASFDDMPEEDEEDKGAQQPLSDTDLESMQARLATIVTEGSDAGAQRDELAKMCQTLLSAYGTGMPFLRQQVDAQQETIAALQQQSRLAEQLMSIERDRFMAERASWEAETRALIRTRELEAAAGNRPKRLLDLDVGYHQELEAANKRLEMGNRLMAPRLVDTQQQIESLVTELRHLRAHVILDTSALEGDPQQAQVATKPTTAAAPTLKSGKARTTLGDARAEHLLLAARRVRSLRPQDGSIGRLTLGELKSRGVVGPDGGVGYSEGYGGVKGAEDEPPVTDLESLLSPSSERRVNPTSKQSSSQPSGTPSTARPKQTKRSMPTTPSRSRGAAQVPQTTPGGNFSDLLLAAELATRPGTPSRDTSTSHGPSATMSATRTTTGTQYIFESPSKKQRRQPPATIEWVPRRQLEEESAAPRASSTTDDRHESALDLLALASQDVAQGSSSVLAAAARFEGMMEGDQEGYQSQSRGDTPLGPAIKLEGSSKDTPLRSHPSNTPPARGFPSSTGDDPFVSGEGSNAFQSPTGAADELLTRAVMEHGEKWDLVSKCVPTRSYHQVRQRWLRKTGAFDKKPANSTPSNDPSPLGRGTAPGEQASPTPKSRKRRDA